MALILRLSIFLILCGSAVADETLHALTYDFSLKGVENASIEKRFNAVSSLKTFKLSPVYSTLNLNKRICDDYDLLLQLLDAKGFYDATVSVSQKEKNHHTDIVFQVVSGVRYRIDSMTIELNEAHDDVIAVYPFLFEDLPVQVGNYVSAEKIHEAFGIIIERFGNCGYPYAKIKDHSIELVNAKRIVKVRLNVTPGPRVRFGEIKTDHLVNVPESYIKNRAPWEAGDVFDQRKVEIYREKLSRTRLFDSIVIDHPEIPGDGSEIPLTVAVAERKARTLTAGVKYSLNEGPGATAGWTHRNFSGSADRLRSAISYGQKKSKFEMDYEWPDFIWKKKTLAPSFEATFEDNDSYISQSYGTSLLLRTEFAENSEYYYGVSLDQDRAKQNRVTKTSKLFGLPIGFKLDQRDDLFDPTKGYLLSGSFTPKVGRVGESYFMSKSILSGAHYYAATSKIILASWVRAGVIAGINFSDVIANQRFYSGGGGSIRGYGYQMAGPLDSSFDPTGGKSLLEGGFEARMHILDDWGVAAFIEGGHVSQQTLPYKTDKMFYGAGLGLRYYTDFGPIRADIAMPLKRRKKQNGKFVDDAFHFYISIGQGF